MKTFWIILLVAFLVFVIVNAIRGRHYSSSVYRARFLNRMSRERQPDPTPLDSTCMVPVILGAATGSSPAPAAAPDCAPGVADASGACSADGGGAAS